MFLLIILIPKIIQLVRSCILLTMLPWRWEIICAPDFARLFDICILSRMNINGNPVRNGGIVFLEKWILR